ncbi:ABC transporter permease [Salipiger sp.]|uniref:ABC transporter permease n=1 Tax=Salipiger sp. TaxID=2078585 RepID=UPI003A979AE6
MPLVPSAILLGVGAMAVFSGTLAPHDPNAMALLQKLAPPAFMDGGTAEHLLGTDKLGRDILSRLIYGTRVSIAVGLVALLLGGAVGTLLGIVAGYDRRWDGIIMRVTDAMFAFPTILLALVLATLLGASIPGLIFVMVLMVWSKFARMARAEVLSIKERDYVKYAQMIGIPAWRIVLRHIFPNLLNMLAVLFTLQVGWVIMTEASLSFLGVGIPAPTPSWGGMVTDGRNILDTHWWVSLFPCLMIIATCLSLNIFGDWLREVMDPRQRQI